MTDILVRNDDDQAVRRRHRDQGDGSFAEVVTLPDELITGSQGRAQRLRVDPGQTGFFDGRMFRAFIEAVIPKLGPMLQARLTSPVDFILWSQVLTLTQGALRCEVFTGATPSGSWTSVPVIGVNRMSERPAPLYTPLITIEKGGDFTGGTAVDLLMIRAAGTNGQASNVGVSQSERGLPAGTYYIRFSTLAGGLIVNDDAQMIYAIEWEERTPIT